MLIAIITAKIIEVSFHLPTNSAAIKGEIKAPIANEACKILSPAVLLPVILATTTFEVLLSVPLPTPVNVNAIIKSIGLPLKTYKIIPSVIPEEVNLSMNSLNYTLLAYQVVLHQLKLKQHLKQEI